MLYACLRFRTQSKSNTFDTVYCIYLHLIHLVFYDTKCLKCYNIVYIYASFSIILIHPTGWLNLLFWCLFNGKPLSMVIAVFADRVTFYSVFFTVLNTLIFYWFLIFSYTYKVNSIVDWKLISVIVHIFYLITISYSLSLSFSEGGWFLVWLAWICNNTWVCPSENLPYGVLPTVMLFACKVIILARIAISLYFEDGVQLLSCCIIIV